MTNLLLVHVSAFYGILFAGREEAAYSNFRLWESMGSVITYAYSPYLCTDLKIYLLVGLLLIGIIGYATTEYLVLKNNRNQLDITKAQLDVLQNKKSGEVPD